MLRETLPGRGLKPPLYELTAGCGEARHEERALGDEPGADPGRGGRRGACRRDGRIELRPSPDVSLYDTLVIEIETLSLEDADEIASRVADTERARFSEILVYARPEPAARSWKVRRVRWTRSGGFEVLEYLAPVGS